MNWEIDEPFAKFGSARPDQRPPPGARAFRPHPYASSLWLALSFLPGAEGSRPVGGNLNGQTEADPRRSSGPIRVAERAKAVPDMVRAGRPRSRGGILHTINREHRLHHARESGEAPDSALKNHSPLEGVSQPSRMAKGDAEGGQRGVPRGRNPPSSRRGANATSRGSQPFPAINPAY